MDWKGAPQTTNIVDLRKPPDATRERKPASFAAMKEYKDIGEYLQARQNAITDPEDSEFWEENEAYTKWFKKRADFERQSILTTAQNFKETMTHDPMDPEIARYELQTISIGERLKNLHQIMRPYNGR